MHTRRRFLDGLSRMSMSRYWIGLTLVLLFVSGASHAGPTKAQKKAIKAALPLYEARFDVPNASSDLAWDRATEWVTLMSGMRLDVATDTVLQTYTPPDPASMLLYCRVNRRKDAEETTFTAECAVNNLFGVGDTRRGSAMLRRYIMTGEEPCLVNGSRRIDAAVCLLDCSENGQTCEPKEVALGFPTEEPAEADGSCTVDQITAMVRAGLSDDQIKAACGTE